MTILNHELNMGKKAVAIWTAAIGGFIACCVFLFPEMAGQMSTVSNIFASMGAFTAAFGMDRLNFGTLTGFYAIECGNILGIGGALFASMLASNMLCKEEKEHTAGYVSTALFLPMVAMGMHHGLVALYSVQLESFGYVTLYPALAMAGAGQVGAAVAIYFKAKKCGNTRLKNVITGALPAGLLGIGEPLIYGVTLPMGKPLIIALAGLSVSF